MTIESEERRIPLDTFPLRLVISRLHAGHKTADAAARAVGVSGQTWLNWESGKHTESAKRPSMTHWIAERMEVDEKWLREGGPLREAGPNGPGGRAVTREFHECLIDHSDDALTRLIAAQWRDPALEKEAA